MLSQDPAALSAEISEASRAISEENRRKAEQNQQNSPQMQPSGKKSPSQQESTAGDELNLGPTVGVSVEKRRKMPMKFKKTVNKVAHEQQAHPSDAEQPSNTDQKDNITKKDDSDGEWASD